jgi:hypothetical protein
MFYYNNQTDHGDATEGLERGRIRGGVIGERGCEEFKPNLRKNLDSQCHLQMHN